MSCGAPGERDEPAVRGPAIRNISDTARWVAAYRAHENERPDALFRDPFARRLAGERGERIARATASRDRHDWPWTTRTWLFDRLIGEQVRDGADLVVNLAAGLDARPYRMPLPASLRWIEVDLPDLLAYKEEVLKGEKPGCRLERVPLDLSDAAARRDWFERWGREAQRALIITEGIVTYLTAEEVASLARDLAAPPGFQRWAVEIVSPGLLRMLQRQLGPHLEEARAPLRFGPEEGPEFFTRHGWRPIDVRSMLKTAARLKRLPLWLRLVALLPESMRRQGSRPWSGVCLLAKQPPP